MTFYNPVTFLGSEPASNMGDTDTGIPFPGKPIKIGSIGNDVIDVQDQLSKLGFDLKNEERGVFGPETERVLKLYQGQNRLPVTGVADSQTWQKLFGRTLVSIPLAQRTASLGSQVIKASASYTMDGSSQVTISYLDPGFKMMAANHFQVRRKIRYQGRQFEIAAVETQQSQGGSPMVTIEARSAPIQAMKRDKTPEKYGDMSASDFAIMIAGRFGMRAFVEKTEKKQTIVKAKNTGSDESVWSVLTRLANDEQFVCFESDNNLFFCSQQYLLGRLTVIPLQWPPSDFGGRAILISTPRMRRSDDDPLAADGSATVDRANGVKMRAGQTVSLSGIPNFSGLYLVTEVRFDDNSPEPVEIFFRKPEKKKA